MLSEAERSEASYNARDVLSMCRMWPFIVADLEKFDVTEVYEGDRQMADLALQMTRVGLPVNSDRREEIGNHLRQLRDAALETLRPYTEGSYREAFLGNVALFFAAKARGGEPTNGSVRCGPTRATFEYDAARAALKGWKDYRKKLEADIEASPKGQDDIGEHAAEVLEADDQIAAFEQIVKEKKKQLAVSLFEKDDYDGLIHSEESALEIRCEIRRSQAQLALEKRGVNFGAKVQQCAILRAAGVPLIKRTEKSGLPKIDKEVLEALARHPAAKAMLSYILTEKTINVYIEGEKRAGKGGGRARPVMVTEDGYIHPEWTIHKITGRWGSSPNCFDGDTEYLTNLGWIRACDFGKLAELKPIRVAQFWHQNQTIDFVEPAVIIERPYSGEMVQLKRRNIDLLLTPDHRLLLGKRSGEWEDVLAKDFAPDRKMWMSGLSTDWGSIAHPREYVAFLCAVQADGSWNGDGSGVTFGLTRSRKIRRLREILRRLNLKWSERRNTCENPFKKGKTRRRIIFYVNTDPICDNVRLLLGKEKSFGSWLLSWNRSSIEMFLEEIMLWDGSYTRRNCYSSSSKINADWVQTLFILTGRRAYLRPYNSSEVQKKTNWQVDVCQQRSGWTTNTNVDRVEWNSMVYCLTVPSGYVVVRRNGKVMVVGQCQNWSVRAGGGAENLRSMIEAPEGYVFISADQKQLEARLIAAMSSCKYMLDTFARGDDIHSAFAAIGFPNDWTKLNGAFLDHKKMGKCKCADCLERGKMRDVTKRLEYGFFYGGKEQTLFESIAKDFPNSTLGQVRDFINRLNSMLPEVLRWRQQILDTALRNRMIRSPILGRMQIFPLGRVDPNVIYNFGPQSGGADIWLIGAQRFMERWDQMEFDARLIQNGHDSVLVLVREELAEPVEKDVCACWSLEWSGVQFEMESKIVKRWSGD
jgi:hypothetical protein